MSPIKNYQLTAAWSRVSGWQFLCFLYRNVRYILHALHPEFHVVQVRCHITDQFYLILMDCVYCEVVR